MPQAKHVGSNPTLPTKLIKEVITIIWKDVVDYEGYYKVNDLGEVKSVDRIIIDKNGKEKHLKGKLLKKGVFSNGYTFVSLRPIKGTTNKLIHRIVAESFLDNKNNLPVVNHLDEDRKNNKVFNLEWVTHSENVEHGRKYGKAEYCYIKKQVTIINEIDENIVLSFETRKEAGEFFNKSKCWLNNKYKQVGRPFTYKGWIVL